MNDALIKRIWDGFGPGGQNMPYAEFHKEMKGLSDQKQIQKDLQDIELQKARHRSNQIRIDRGK